MKKIDVDDCRQTFDTFKQILKERNAFFLLLLFEEMCLNNSNIGDKILTQRRKFISFAYLASQIA